MFTLAGVLLIGPTPTAPHLPPPGTLSPGARSLLHARMQRHGEEMQGLSRAVVLLDYDAVAERARRVAEEPQLARPLSRDATELNAQLPGRFFELQDRLKAESTRLQSAAQAHQPAAMAEAFGALSQTCVECHATYREGDGSRAQPAGPGSLPGAVPRR